MTAGLLSELPPARKETVTTAVGLRPVPRLPLEIAERLTSNLLSGSPAGAAPRG
jgi:hypothetical protein